jgi:hypothetical protein
MIAVPHPRLGVDGLADRAEQTDRGQIELLRDLRPSFMNERIAVGAV